MTKESLKLLTCPHCALTFISHTRIVRINKLITTQTSSEIQKKKQIDATVFEVMSQLNKGCLHNCRKLNKSLKNNIKRLFWKTNVLYSPGERGLLYVVDVSDGLLPHQVPEMGLGEPQQAGAGRVIADTHCEWDNTNGRSVRNANWTRDSRVRRPSCACTAWRRALPRSMAERPFLEGSSPTSQKAARVGRDSASRGH